jgi:quercetin dioxygenase-like cupin family protein
VALLTVAVAGRAHAAHDLLRRHAHFHTVADEYVVVTGGSGELLINGVWRPVKAGDVHVCPRGIVHATRALGENLQYLSIFTPHLPPGTDINWVK